MKTTTQIRFSCVGFNSVLACGEYSAALIFAQRLFDRQHGRGKQRVVKIDGPLNGMVVGIPGASYAFVAYAVPARDEWKCSGHRSSNMVSLTIKRCYYEPQPLPEWTCEAYKEAARRRNVIIRLYGMPIEQARELLKLESLEELIELLRNAHTGTELHQTIREEIEAR